jgi:hypothetical protein
MTTIKISKTQIEEFITGSCSFEVNQFNYSTLWFNIEWSNNSSGNDPEIEYDVYVNEDFEYEIELCDIKEHCDLVEQVEGLVEEVAVLNEQLEIANQVIAEYAKAIKVNNQSFWAKLFNK